MLNQRFNRLGELAGQKKTLLGFLASTGLIVITLFQTLGLNILVLTPLAGLCTSLFLPTYPLFFIIIQKTKFSRLEKLGLTIISNSSFYILAAYVGQYLGVAITGFFFIISVILVYYSSVAYILIKDFRTACFKIINNPHSKSTALNKQDSRKTNVLLRNLIAKFKKIGFNGVLLIIFLLLLCILPLVKFQNFFGVDPWLHIHTIKIITEINTLPIYEYYGTLGLHTFSAVIHFFTGAEPILIARYFVFFTYPVSALIIYNILMRIFKKKDYAIIGVFLLEFTSLGFDLMMFQFWPSGLALIQCLTVFLLLYIRMQNLIREEEPTKKHIFSNQLMFYLLIASIFISAAFTHVLTSGIFLLSFLWIYFLYFLKNWKRGIDFLFLVLLTLLYLSFSYLGIGSGHFWFIPDFSSISVFYIILFAIAGLVGGSLLIYRFLISIKFTSGRFEKAIFGKGDKRIFKNFEKHYIKPLVFGIAAVTALFVTVVSLYMFRVEVTFIFITFEIMVLMGFAIWGLFVYQKVPRGKIIFIWASFFLLFIAIVAIFFFNNLGNITYIFRITYLTHPIIIIGFISYILKIVRTKKIKAKKMKLMLLLVVIFSLISAFSFKSSNFADENLGGQETTAINWFAEKTTDNKTVYTSFGWNYAFIYYDYPYNSSELVERDNIHEFIKYDEDLFPPENHYDENGTNKLKEYKEKYGTDVYIFLEKDYYLRKGWELKEGLSSEQMEKYNDLEYLNKIYSVKGENGETNSFYWVI